MKVVGKTEPVVTYELLATEKEASDDLKELVETFKAGRALYEKMQWDEALEKFNDCLELEPHHPDRAGGCKTTPSHIYIARIQDYKENPPVAEGETWDGVHIATEK